VSGSGHEHTAGHVHDHDGLRLACGAAEPALFAGRADVTLGPAAGPAGVRDGVASALAELGRLLAEAGCTLVGHIKGTLDAGDEGVLQFSVTALAGVVGLRGDVRPAAERAVLTLNVIVFGVSEAAVAEAVDGSLGRWPAAQVRWR
jgi:hypothetical protein